MIVNKLLEQIKDKKLLEYTFKVGFLPSDGSLVLGMPEGIITFNETEFIIYTFPGIFKPKYDSSLKFKFDEIKSIEMGKYNFKDRYIKLIFNDDKYLVFNYFYKQRKFINQGVNVKIFVEKLESISQLEN